MDKKEIYFKETVYFNFKNYLKESELRRIEYIFDGLQVKQPFVIDNYVKYLDKERLERFLLPNYEIELINYNIVNNQIFDNSLKFKNINVKSIVFSKKYFYVDTKENYYEIIDPQNPQVTLRVDMHDDLTLDFV